MRYKMTKKYQICHHQIRFFSSSKRTKIRFRPGLCSGPHWGSLRRSPRPRSRLGRGIPLPIPLPARRLRRLELGAIYCASVLRPPSTQNPGYASGTDKVAFFIYILTFKTYVHQRTYFTIEKLKLSQSALKSTL